MTLRAEVGVKMGDFDLDVTINAAAGETVAVLGPNGAGKTTLLRCLAGLTPLGRGRVELDGRTLDNPDAGIRVAPPERSIGMVFQQHLLFPSMTVLENVAFGQRCQGAPRTEARRRAAELLAAVGLADKAGSRPHQLSGGQSQRVALARALAIEPRLVLLDEPLAALDVTTRAEIRRELLTHLARLDCARLLVTHDPTDAFALADRVVILEAGRVTQSGPLAEVTARPTSAYLADLMGLNLFDGVGTGGELRLAGGARWLVDPPITGPTFAAVHPRDVVVIEGTAAPGSNSMDGVIASVELERDRVLVRVTGVLPISVELAPATALRLGLRPGDLVSVGVAPSAIRTYPRSDATNAISGGSR